MPALTSIVITGFMLLLLFSAALAPVSARSDPAMPSTVELTDWQFDGYSPLEEIPEPSGMCYCPPTDTLFVVDDGGYSPTGKLIRPAAIAELDLNANVLRHLELGDDLEGVCWCELDGMLYACDETGERVYVVDPYALELVRQFTVDTKFDSRELLTPGGNGFEGIEFIPPDDINPTGYFLLLNQDDPHALVGIDYSIVSAAPDGSTVPIASFHLLPEINLGELHYDAAAGELWVVHSWMNVIEILDIHTMQVLRWEVCPGASQEALAIDGDGRLWIGYDLGGVSRYVRQTGSQ